MAGGFPLPHTVYGHGWWLKDEAKMSKSKGNVLDPHVILKTFGPDPLRYFLLREIPIGVDGNFSHEGFLHRVNSDLANDLGNLVHRTLTMILGYQKGVVESGDDEQEKDRAIREGFETLKGRVAELIEDCALSKALEEIWAYISAVNKYLADNEPWKLAQDETKKKRLARILYQTAAAIRGISYLVYPVMPESAQKIWNLLGEQKAVAEELFESCRFENLGTGVKIQRPLPLFPRVALKDFLQEEVPPPAAPKKEERMDIINFDEFKRMDLRVGEILKAEKVPGTDKLLKIEVNIGTEKRTMVAGVGDVYAPEEMVGKKLIVIVNLKPAVIRGIESQAMLLAAETGGKAIIPFFDRDVPAGAKVK
jgi:methionyl-tRNA synthetase